MVNEELINRFELLYPNNTLLSDLRKLLNHDDNFALYRLLDHFTSSHLVKAIKLLTIDKVNYDIDCFSQGQIKSKKWLIDELTKLDLNLGTVFLCAGWYATLATMLFESSIKIDKIRSFDIDPSCVFIAEVFNKPWVVDNWKFKPCTQNIFDINYHSHTYNVYKANGTTGELTDAPDTIINTSCEHIENFDEWYNLIPDNKLIILQTNNYIEIEDHVNCSNSLSEFRIQTPMTTLLYEGELVLDKYTRYMRIGLK